MVCTVDYSRTCSNIPLQDVNRSANDVLDNTAYNLLLRNALRKHVWKMYPEFFYINDFHFFNTLPYVCDIW